MSVTWKQQVLGEVVDYCETHGSRTFALRDFLAGRQSVLQALHPKNNNVAAKIRQQLQSLRDEKLISFVDNQGIYTLRNIDYLQHEKEAMRDADLWDGSEGMKEKSPRFKTRPVRLPEKREHFMETYVRNTGWAREARQTFGRECLIRDCGNRFKKSDGNFYIEVHHIVPLCEGGEDGIWNLSVLCAHHHRMAHFANADSKRDIRKFLLKEVEDRLL